MRFTDTIEVCTVCGKTWKNAFKINNGGSYEYITHTNFSNNIRPKMWIDKVIERTPDEIYERILRYSEGNQNGRGLDPYEALECASHILDKSVIEEFRKKIDVFVEKRKVLQEKRDELKDLLDEIDSEIRSLYYA